MNSKLCLILFGALVALAVLSAAENAEENSLSEEVASSRLARAADADPGKSKKKSKKNKNASKKKNKSKQKNKKKASKKRNKSKRKNNASKMNKKRRNNRKASKKNNKKDRKSRNNKKNREGKSEVPDKCLTTSVNILYNGLYKKASNFDRQSKRIEARVPVIAKKLEKASEYNATLDDLTALLSILATVLPALCHCWLP